MTAFGDRSVPPDAEWLGRALEGLVDRMVAFRRDLHAHPEVAWQEVRTSARVHDELTAAGLAPTGLVAGTGMVCDIEGDPLGPTVGLRAELDALPLQDEKDVPYRSTNPGVAHACGHDVHTSVVVGAGLALTRLAAEGRLPGRVRLLFQPAEEVLPGGALEVLDAKVLDGVARVFALHCDPRVVAGNVATRVGAITAATDSVTVRLGGPGGHTARPQLTVDLVTALADVVTRTPALLSRRVDPRAGLSVVWGRMAAGSAANVIPDRGEAAASVRTLDRDVWEAAPELIPELIREIVAPYQAEVEIDYVRGTPPAVNAPDATEGFRASAAAVLGPDAVHEAAQSMGGEDFAWILDRVPGVLGRLGVRAPGTASAPDLHRGDFDVDETAIGCGIRVLLAAVLGALQDPALTGTPL